MPGLPSRSVALAGAALILSILSCDKRSDVMSPPPAAELDSPYLLGASSGSQNFIHVFANAGAHPYHCRLHSTAHHHEGGTIFVSSQGPDSVFVSIFEGVYDPDSATVRVNGSVRWQNFDEGTHHTVTSD